MWLDPVVLEGTQIRLEPLRETHAADLGAASADAEIYRYMPYVLRSEQDMRGFASRGMDKREAVAAGA